MSHANIIETPKLEILLGLNLKYYPVRQEQGVVLLVEVGVNLEVESTMTVQIINNKRNRLIIKEASLGNRTIKKVEASRRKLKKLKNLI